MDHLTHSDVITLLIEISVMLLAARMFGELARILNQPMVVGEIIAGVVLGPTVLGMISPDLFTAIFPASGATYIALEGIIQVSVVLLLFIAGLEVELALVWQQGMRALYTSLFSLAFPFIVGFTFVYTFPGWFPFIAEEDYFVFSLFIGTVLSITALPVIARVLMDLKLFKSRMGMLIISSAMIIDIVGWLIFAVILNMMETEARSMTVGKTVLLTVGFTLIMMTIGKSLVNRTLPWISKNFTWPGGLLSVSMVMCFLASAFTEYIGIHAVFGAFIIGVVFGDSTHMPDRAKEIVHQFVNNIFAPLFFVSIGLRVDFLANFNISMILFIIVLAFLGKITGGFVGARLGKLNFFQSMAVGFGMNTHGTLEIILGTIALRAGLINKEIFVAIVVMVIVTILISAPLMKYCVNLNREYKKRYKVRLMSKDDDDD